MREVTVTAFLAAFTVLSLSTPARAIDVGDFERMLGTSSAVTDMKWYLKGVGDAYGVTNAVLAANAKPLLYCQPVDAALGTDGLIDLVRRELDSAAGAQLRQARVPVELVVLAALQKNYPCTAAAGQLKLQKN